MISLKNNIQDFIKTISFDYSVTVRPSHSKLEPTYPMITVQEIDNSTQQSINGQEQYANVGYQINIYGKDRYPASADTVCLSILTTLDSELQTNYGFQRTSVTQLPDDNDDSVMRYAIRYNGTLDTINNYLYK